MNLEEALAEVERLRDEVAHADRAVAAAVDQGIARAEKAEAAIARVKALHPNNGGWCDRCRTQHPCATVAALRGDQ